jgi:serine/threonine protein phosphatase PrpC
MPDTRTRCPDVPRRLVSYQKTRSGWYVPLIRLERGSTDLSKANAGDSRTVLGVKGRAKPLSFDHKPQNEGTWSP